MKAKNILIPIGVLGVGAILYKVLLGFVLPIALFVSLGYVLKFLLKGADSDSVEDISQVFKNTVSTSSIENIVEIKPIEEENPDEEQINAEEEKSDQTEKSPEVKKQSEEDSIV